MADPDSSLTKYTELLANRSITIATVESGVSSTLIIAATVGNFLVLWIVYRNRSLRTIPNQFVISLAVSDILMAGICAPPCLAVLVAGKKTFNDFVCQLQGFAIACLACVSLLTMMLVAVNRYFLIVRPQKYHRIFSPKKTKVMIMSVWVLSLMEPLPYLLSGHRYQYHPGKVFCFQVLRINVYTLLGYVYVAVPLVILTACYWTVFRVLRQHQLRIRKLRNSCALEGVQPSQEVSFEDINVTRTLFLTVCGFLICWIPISIVDFVGFVQGEWTLDRQVYLMYTFLGQLSTTLNPVIYGVMNKTFRDAYTTMLCHCRTPHCTTSQPSDNSHPTKESKCSIV